MFRGSFARCIQHGCGRFWIISYVRVFLAGSRGGGDDDSVKHSGRIITFVVGCHFQPFLTTFDNKSRELFYDFCQFFCYFFLFMKSIHISLLMFFYSANVLFTLCCIDRTFVPSKDSHKGFLATKRLSRIIRNCWTSTQSCLSSIRQTDICIIKFILYLR